MILCGILIVEDRDEYLEATTPLGSVHAYKSIVLMLCPRRAEYFFWRIGICTTRTMTGEQSEIIGVAEIGEENGMPAQHVESRIA